MPTTIPGAKIKYGKRGIFRQYPKIFKIYSDCDGDCLLYIVAQKGVACHTGAESCFFNLLYEKDKENRLD